MKSDSIKVLVINTVPTSKNGITNVIMNYLGAMDTNGLTIDYLSLNKPDKMFIEMVKSKGGRLYVLPRSIKIIISYLISLIKLVKKNSYKIVHIHGNSHTVILELIAAWLAGCKIRIVHSHNTTCSCPMIHTLLTPIFNKLYTHGLACGKDAGYWMYGRKPFVVFNNGVNTELFAFNQSIREIYRKELRLHEENVLVGHVGLFNEQKNHHFLVRVFNELYLKDNRYRLLLIGDGELRPMIIDMVFELGLNNVVYFLGNISNVSDYLNAIDVILMPSLYEGLPLALIEQQVNGLKCIVSDSISKETDKTGNILFLSLNASAEKWAEVVIKNNTSSREYSSKKCTELIKKAGYCIQTEAKRLEIFYREITNDSDIVVLK